jgi:hypothetical protein
MIRLLFLLHRYLGIGVGLLMSTWCLSGLVMLYVGYPTLSQRERLAHLAPLDWHGCCAVSRQLLADADRVGSFRIEMLAGRPVLQLGAGADWAGLIDLDTGAPIAQVLPAQAASVAADYLSGHRPGAVTPDPAPAPRLLGLVDSDQWTLEGIVSEERPLYRFALRDGQGSELYVSRVTGRAVQLTTRRERFWNWLGAVPHWLYFSSLRRHALLWSQLVIGTALIGCFLTLTGLYIGVRQLLRRPAGRWSAYRGVNLWHHLVGLLFGPFALSWVLSGLLSMNPWGLMQGAGAAAERAQLRGAPITGAQLRDTLRALAAAQPQAVSIASAPLEGRLYLIATDRRGVRLRLDARAAVQPLTAADRRFIALTLHGDARGLRLLGRGDDYYFTLPNAPVELPVWRVLSRDGTHQRFYLDPLSGQLAASLDRADQHYRWWHDALHRLDFVAAIRGRPQWDALMWLLMSGVTALCVSGTWLGYRHLRH